MTLIQLIMLGASAFFAYKIYEHIQTLKDPQTVTEEDTKTPQRSAAAFSTFDASKLIEKADEAREKEELDKALAIYSEANIKEPKNAEILFKMGYTLVLQKRDEEAVDYFLDSIEVDGANPFAYKELAGVYERMGEDAKAQEYSKKASDLDENI